MPSLGVAIMAHPERESWVRELVSRIDDKGLVVVWDTKGDVYDTGRRAWLEGADSPHTHWLVLQDDALCCRDLVSGVEKALPHIAPSSPLSLYIGTSRPYAIRIQSLVDVAASRDVSFVVTNKLNWGVGVVVPVIQIRAMIDFCDRRSDSMYDRRIGKWFFDNHIPTFYTWPSLVDHKQGPSLLGNRKAERRAHNFIGREGSALDVDWGKGGVVAEKSRSRKAP